MKNANEILFSNLEYDVHPYEWVSALLADYNTLREKAVSAGVEITDDPDAESQCLSEVERLCKAAGELWRAKEFEKGVVNVLHFRTELTA